MSVSVCSNSSIVHEFFYKFAGNYSTGVNDFIESAYQYGRDYISSSIFSLLRDSSNNNQQDAQLDKFESQVLELWDRIYQYWLDKNNQFQNSNKGEHQHLQNNIDSADSTIPYGPSVSSEAITSSVGDLLAGMLNASVPTRVLGNAVNFSVFSQFAMNNMGTLTSVLEQGWTLLKGNIGLVLTVVTECLRILLR